MKGLYGFLLGLLLCAQVAFAVPAYSPQTIATQAAGINQVLTQVDPQYPWAAMVVDADTGQVIYQHRANEWMTPASTQKVVTATAAVKELGELYRFKTQLWTHGLIKEGVLHGSVTITFSGDPSLTHADLEGVLRALKRAGIHRITGSVRFDRHVRTSIPYGPGWMWDDLSYRYSAPMGALILDKNSFLLTISSASSHIHGRPHLSTRLPLGVVSLSNHVRVIRRRDKNCPLLIYSTADNHYNLSGCVSRTREPRHEWLAIRDPNRYASRIVRQTLKGMNISFNGHVISRRLQAHSRLLATHVSEPLSELIHEMLKESDNMIANALLQTVGAHYYHRTGSWDTGSRAVKAILSPMLGLSVSDWRIVDGSGESRYNMLSPHLLVVLLQAIYHQPDLARVIIPALPLAGVDGTLAGRMREPGVQGMVHAKTGTMTGVSALTGFVNRPDKHTWLFAVMTNGLVHKASMAHVWEDALCQELSQSQHNVTLLSGHR